MGNKTSIHVNRHPSLWESLGVLLLLLLFAVSCTEQEDVEADDYANWQERNDAYTADVAKRCQRVKSFTKDQQTEGAVSDYVYYEVLETGTGTDCPYYTDTVRVSYRGRLIPTASYPEGLVFDETFTGNFSWQTTGVITTLASGFVDGFTTILQHMHRGDRWRVYIPYQLGYNTTSKDGIPAICSNLIFDIALVDFSHPDHNLPQWSARQTE